MSKSKECDEDFNDFDDFEYDPELEAYYDYYKDYGDLLNCNDSGDFEDNFHQKNIGKILQNQLDKEKEEFYNEEDEIDRSFRELLEQSL